MSNTFTIIVPMEFSEDDIQTILKSYNSLWVEEGETPITIEEFKNNKALQDYLISELQVCTVEIVDGSYGAMANDWLMDLKDYR